MKKSELRRLVAKYRELEQSSKKNDSLKIQEKLKEIKHRYFHETGRILKSDLQDNFI